MNDSNGKERNVLREPGLPRPPAPMKFETEITLVGDQSTIREIIILLSFIRNIVDEGRSQDITVSVGKNIKTDGFGMAVNGMEIPDIKSKDRAVIN